MLQDLTSDVRQVLVIDMTIIYIYIIYLLPGSHDRSVSLQSFLGFFFGEKLNKSFPRVSPCMVSDDGDAIFHYVQIWKTKTHFFAIPLISYC